MKLKIFFNLIIIYYIKSDNNVDGPWHLQLLDSNFETPIDKQEYFCKELLEICAKKNCYHYLGDINNIPSQRLYTDITQPSKENLRIPIDNFKHNS